MLQTTPAVTTYNNILNFNPHHVADCATVEDVIAAVKQAVSAGLRIRPIGAGRSWGPEIVTDKVCLKLNGLNQVHSIDTATKRVVVDAGARLGDLTGALAAKGLCLPSLSFFPEVTVGGAIATATHGTSPHWGTLSDTVLSLDIVLASGEVKTFGPDSPPGELRAARAAIGMLGVIVRLELQAADMTWVRYSNQTMPLAAYPGQLPSIFAQHEHVFAHWILGQDRVFVECLESRPAPTKGFRRYVKDSDGGGAWPPNPGFARTMYYQSVAAAKNIIFPKRRRILEPDLGPPAERQNGIRKVWMSMQYGVPAEQLQTAIEMIRTSPFAAEHAGQDLEMKFLKAEDKTFLGPNADADMVLFNMFWLVGEDIKFSIFNNFETLLRGIHARPHWGKFHTRPDPAYMQKAYPGWNAFETVRAKFDPDGVFTIFQ